MAIFHSSTGLLAFVVLAWLMSENRKKIHMKALLAGILLQLLLAFVLLKFPLAQKTFFALNQAVIALQEATNAGTAMVFGYLGGGPLPFEEKFPGSAFILAGRVFPVLEADT